MDIVIDAWIRKGKFAKLAEVWVKGGVLNWNRLYEKGTPRLLSLPSYPFAKTRIGYRRILTKEGPCRGTDETYSDETMGTEPDRTG
ncbi:hypothetical protein QNN00_18935 [Bacillus velezensis]|nr:hypothetical protein [Bacillus velezensis]